MGASVRRRFEALGWTVAALSRSPQKGDIAWDGRTLGAWTEAFEGADVVLNLAGRSVNCRYTQANLDEMMRSRVDSTRIVGEAIRACVNPPKLWLQASTATIYAHRFDAPNDEAAGILGGDEPDAPPKWNASIAIAKAWEKEFDEADTPRTRKIALRSAMTMSPDAGSIFETLARLARLGLAGKFGDGRQYVSWIHELDFNRALEFLIEREAFAGAVNLTSPTPLPSAEFNRILRESVGTKFGLPATKWMLEIGALIQQTETELILKSRRVVPGRLLDAGFEFKFPTWPEAADDLVKRLNEMT